jgi:hypothetical protein
MIMQHGGRRKMSAGPRLAVITITGTGGHGNTSCNTDISQPACRYLDPPFIANPFILVMHLITVKGETGNNS